MVTDGVVVLLSGPSRTCPLIFEPNHHYTVQTIMGQLIFVSYGGGGCSPSH